MTVSSTYQSMTQNSSYSRTCYISLHQQSTRPNHFIVLMTNQSIFKYFLRWIISLFMLFLASPLLCRLVGWNWRFIRGGWILVMIGLVLGVFIGVVIVKVLKFYSYYCYDQLQYDSAPPWSTIWTQSYYDSSLSYSHSHKHSSSYSVTNSAGPWSRIFSFSDDGTLTYPVDDVIILNSTINAGLTFLYWTGHHKIGSICCRLCWSYFIAIVFSLWYWGLTVRQ